MFDKRPDWMNPIFYETLKDENDEPVAARISITLNLKLEDERDKWRIMDSMKQAIENTLIKTGNIKGDS